MDDTIQAIIEILNETEHRQLSELLNQSSFELIDSGSFGSKVNSTKSTAIILSPPKFNARITNLSTDERERIINAIFQLYPVQDNAPEITEVIFKADLKLTSTKPTSKEHREGLLDEYGNLLDEDEPELEKIDGYFVITKDSFEKQIERNKTLNRTYFEFEHDYINYFPDSFWELEQLESITFKNCKIEVLPSGFLKLKKLAYLLFEDSILDTSPNRFYLPSGLKVLQFADCSLTEFPSVIRHLKHLESLGLPSSKIKHLPDVFSNLRKLEELDLGDNEIEKLPESFPQLTSLKSLNLSGNHLRKFPEAILELRNLEEVYLSYNHIDSIPYKIESLTRLEKLHLNSNELRALPTSISSLKGISSLPLEDNPFTDMPEIKDKTQVEIYYYLDQLEGKSTFTTEWEMPEGFRVAFQQYLNYFSEFVYQLLGEQLMFETQKTANGLKLFTKPTEKLPISQIDELLKAYMDKDKTFVAPPEGLSLEQRAELLELKGDLKRERNQLLYNLQQQIERVNFLKTVIKDKDRDIENLNVTIRFFQDKLTPALLKMSPSNDSSGYIPQMDYKYLEGIQVRLKEVENVVRQLQQDVRDDLILSNTQREEAFNAIAEVMEELQKGVKPSSSNMEKLTNILKGMKELSSTASQLLNIWKQIQG